MRNFLEFSEKTKEIIDAGGGFLLVQNYSLERLLSQVYSEHKWFPAKFVDSSSIWENEHLAKYFIDWLKNEPEALKYLHKYISNMEIYGDMLLPLLFQAFPNYRWGKSSYYVKKSQYVLNECLQTMFPTEGSQKFHGNFL